MSDDPNKKGYQDRSRVAADQDHEVQYFAQANRISPEQVRELIEKHGNDRATLEREASKLV